MFVWYIVERAVTNWPHVPQGHKRAPSDVSVGSSEDEKICLSPTLLESVPEKMEAILPATTPTGLPVEEPPAPADGGALKEATSALSDDDVRQQQPPAAAAADAASPEMEAEPAAPVAQMHRLEINAEGNKEVEVEEKEVDTGEILPDEQNSNKVPEVTEEKMAESESPTEEEEDQYQHLKMTLTLPEQHQVVAKEENKEKTGKDGTNVDNEKVPDKTKDGRRSDSHSGSVSATDNRSVDLNLSISSFLSKAKEPASVSVQVTPIYESLSLFIMRLNSSLYCVLKRQKKTLKKTRKFIVDGVEVSVTTSKIVTDNDTKNEEMRFLRSSHEPCPEYERKYQTVNDGFVLRVSFL